MAVRICITRHNKFCHSLHLIIPECNAVTFKVNHCIIWSSWSFNLTNHITLTIAFKHNECVYVSQQIDEVIDDCDLRRGSASLKEFSRGFLFTFVNDLDTCRISIHNVQVFEETRPYLELYTLYQNGSWGDHFLISIPANGGCHVENSSNSPGNQMLRIGLVL